MRQAKGLGHVLVLGACLVALGCSAGVSGTPSAPQPRSYQVQAVEGTTDLGAIIARLPARIAVADAARLLVSIPQDRIRPAPTYGLQDTDVAHHDWMRAVGWPLISSYSRHRATVPLTTPALYYPYGSYYFPYSLIGSVYYPYSSRCAALFLYRTRDFYSPYAYSDCGTPAAVPVPSGVS
jgi:hypothetical protein